VIKIREQPNHCQKDWLYDLTLKQIISDLNVSEFHQVTNFGGNSPRKEILCNDQFLFNNKHTFLLGKAGRMKGMLHRHNVS
jgi:hypothetical protein